MRICLLVIPDGESFVIGRDHHGDDPIIFHPCSTNPGMVFCLSEYDEHTKAPKDDGTGNEASWWSMYFGKRDHVIQFIQTGAGMFSEHDRNILLPILTESKSNEESIWAYCIPKPRVRCSGRFIGPDRQSWADQPTMESLLRRVLAKENVPVHVVL